ncbi:MAG: hypothetical protein K2X81_17100, partial [Candidatus Obscuribacterales bacterium]|nr:hypothetical protein [Candidatus Obscuribacterales bacterium]
MNLFRRIALAASYVTSIPCLKKAESEDELKGLAKFLPTVGIIIGIFLAAIAFACNSGQISPLLT